jgi:hypothetical protein
MRPSEGMSANSSSSPSGLQRLRYAEQLSRASGAEPILALTSICSRRLQTIAGARKSLRRRVDK